MRNLSDHRGNNLLHVLAGSGNADALAWLCSSFGPEMQDALLDENKRGLTPVVAAIQAGRLEALQFLVDHTSARERLAPVDGDRSLLHIAAKYGKVRVIYYYYFLFSFSFTDVSSSFGLLFFPPPFRQLSNFPVDLFSPFLLSTILIYLNVGGHIPTCRETHISEPG